MADAVASPGPDGVRMHDGHDTSRRGSVLVPVLRGVNLGVAPRKWMATIVPAEANTTSGTG